MNSVWEAFNSAVHSVVRFHVVIASSSIGATVAEASKGWVGHTGAYKEPPLQTHRFDCGGGDQTTCDCWFWQKVLHSLPPPVLYHLQMCCLENSRWPPTWISGIYCFYRGQGKITIDLKGKYLNRKNDSPLPFTIDLIGFRVYPCEILEGYLMQV